MIMVRSQAWTGEDVLPNERLVNRFASSVAPSASDQRLCLRGSITGVFDSNLSELQRGRRCTSGDAQALMHALYSGRKQDVQVLMCVQKLAFRSNLRDSSEISEKSLPHELHCEHCTSDIVFASAGSG